MSTAWEDIGVRTVLDIGQAKASYIQAQDLSDHMGEQVNIEAAESRNYIEVLERALLELGIEIHDNGAVSPVTPRKPTTEEAK